MQIFTHLVTNSIVYGFAEKENATISINIKKEAKELTIKYKDNGCGIEKDILPQIFNPFFTTNKQKGPGLGLHIVFNLVTQKLLGKISCTSTKGERAEFIIEIVDLAKEM